MSAAALRATQSLWLAGEASRFPALDRELEVDVAILGGGIAGLTTALLLKRAGRRVAVLERRSVAAGATGLTTAKVSALQQIKYAQISRLHGADKAAAYAQASLAAVDRIERIIQEEEIACAWERTAAYTYAADRDQVEMVEREAAAAQAAGLTVKVTGETPLPFAVPTAVRLDDQAQFHPVRYVRALAGAVDGEGRTCSRTAASAPSTRARRAACGRWAAPP
jgi:glycine/D-amino acid oxidase-like deaminating enzyme